MLEDEALATLNLVRAGHGTPGVLLCILAKAAVGASVKVYLRKGKTLPRRDRSDDKSVRNSPADTRAGEEGGGGGNAGAASPAACGEAHGKADTHTAACGGPCGGAGGHALPEGTAACGEPMLQVYPEGLQPMGTTHTGT